MLGELNQSRPPLPGGKRNGQLDLGATIICMRFQNVLFYLKRWPSCSAEADFYRNRPRSFETPHFSEGHIMTKFVVRFERRGGLSAL